MLTPDQEVLAIAAGLLAERITRTIDAPPPSIGAEEDSVALPSEGGDLFVKMGFCECEQTPGRRNWRMLVTPEEVEASLRAKPNLLQNHAEELEELTFTLLFRSNGISKTRRLFTLGQHSEDQRRLAAAFLDAGDLVAIGEEYIWTSRVCDRMEKYGIWVDGEYPLDLFWASQEERAVELYAAMPETLRKRFRQIALGRGPFVMLRTIPQHYYDDAWHEKPAPSVGQFGKLGLNAMSEIAKMLRN